MEVASVSGKVLSVGDLFCGAGGFSEGFRQAGFRIRWGVDSWKPAVDTFAKNHRGAEPILNDIMELEPGELDPVDVLIGSPPCVHFSPANRGGNGDAEAGMRLVRRFLWFVRRLKPQYWIMENVPNLVSILEANLDENQRYPLSGGSVPIPRRLILDAADYGVAQHRKRMFAGDFPIPEATHDDRRRPCVPLAKVLAALPDPADGPPSGRTRIRDPNYRGLSILSRQLRDHVEDRRWKLTLYDRQRAKQQKQHHAVYGPMSYPDKLDRPSRTITATRTGGSRSTIIVRTGQRGLRTLTMREAACVQGFPLTYQFWSDSIGEKDALAGNAVPPPVARAIADAIRADQGQPLLRQPFIESSPELPRPLDVQFRVPRLFPARRHFHAVVPVDWRHDHRVELDNQFPRASSVISAPEAPAIPVWKTRLYLGYAKEYECYELGLDLSANLLLGLLDAPTLGVDCDRSASLLLAIAQRCGNGFPDSKSLQERWSGRRRTGVSPDAVCDFVARAVERSFPNHPWKERYVPIEQTNLVLRRALRSWGKGACSRQPLPMTIRLLASTVALTVVCARLNDGPEVPLALMNAIAEGPESFRRSLNRLAKNRPEDDAKGNVVASPTIPLAKRRGTGS